MAWDPGRRRQHPGRLAAHHGITDVEHIEIELSLKHPHKRLVPGQSPHCRPADARVVLEDGHQ
ncbi:hypothetical protein [Streptomyces sp. YIM S03343]